MIAAHCLLTGFDVGAIKVIEKSGAGAADTLWMGIDEKRRMNDTNAKVAPAALSLSVEDLIIFS